MEALLEEANKLSEAIESIQVMVDNFRKRIPVSKSLAQDAESFCEELVKLLGTGPDLVLREAGNLRDKVLDLEKKIEDLEESKDNAESEAKEAKAELSDCQERFARFLRDELLPKHPDAVLRAKVELFADEIIRDPEVSISNLSIRI